MNITFKLISRSNPSGSRSNPLGSRSNLDYLSRILKLSALSCALVLTTFNVGQATEDNINTNNNSYNYTDISPDKHLQLAKQEFSKLENRVQIKLPEDNMPILKRTNETFSHVSTVLQNLINSVDSQLKIFKPEVVLQQAIEYCFLDLRDISKQLNNIKNDLNIDYLTKKRSQKQIKKLDLVFKQCLKIVCHLITYRSTK